jgi:hypothetical protein
MIMKPQPAPVHSLGRKLPIEEVATIVLISECLWPVEVVATIMAESGGYEWVRPIVVKQPDQDQRAHLSVDRGICQFNSYWWSHVPDRTAYDPYMAIPVMCAAANAGQLGYWSAYGTANYESWLPMARKAVKSEQQWLEPTL